MTALARDPLPEPRAAFGAIRMIADDMTGALDTAAAFAGLASPLRVGIAVQDSRSLVLDIGTRERAREDAATAAQAAAALLAPAPAGSPSSRSTACCAAMPARSSPPSSQRPASTASSSPRPFPNRAAAPAPAGRSGSRAEHGRRRARTWAQLSRQPDIPWRSLVRRACRTAASASSTRKRLRPRPHRREWLCRRRQPALGRLRGPRAGSRPDRGRRALPRSAVGGTAPRAHRHRPCRDGRPARGRGVPPAGGHRYRRHHRAARAVRRGLRHHRPARGHAAPGRPRHHRRALRQPGPRRAAAGTLLVSGGETLRALLPALGATGLDVLGELQPGIALSRLTEGRWRGTHVISKSGAFGEPGLFADLATRASSAPTSAGKIPS